MGFYYTYPYDPSKDQIKHKTNRILRFVIVQYTIFTQGAPALFAFLN